jgi:coenzyme F420-reducing hydrogenase delta subunit
MKQYLTNILIFTCQYCSYAAADLAGAERRYYPANTTIIRLPCTGRVDETHLLSAFEHGADGVLVAGCLEGTCHFLSGNYRAKVRVKRVADILDSIGLDGRRVRMVNLSAGQGAVFTDSVKEFVEYIEDIGLCPKKISSLNASRYKGRQKTA